MILGYFSPCCQVEVATIGVQAILTNTAAERTDLGDSPTMAEGAGLPEAVVAEGEPVEEREEEEGNIGPHQTGELEEVAVVVVVLLVQGQEEGEGLGAGPIRPLVVPPEEEVVVVDQGRLVTATGGVPLPLRLMTRLRLQSGAHTGTPHQAQAVRTT